MLNEKNITKIIIVCLSIYLSFMTIRVSIEDHFVRSSILFIPFSLIYFNLLKKYHAVFLTSIFKILHTPKDKVNVMILSLKKALFIPIILIMLCSITAITSGGYLLTKAETVFDMAQDKSEGDILFSKYRSMGESVLSKTPYVLFFIFLSMPLIYLGILKFKEKLPLKEAIFYPITTTIIIIIILSIVVEIAIFFYYTIGILMGGEN